MQFFSYKNFKIKKKLKKQDRKVSNNAPEKQVYDHEAGKIMTERIKMLFKVIMVIAGKKRAGSRDHLRCVINVTHEKTYDE